MTRPRTPVHPEGAAPDRRALADFDAGLPEDRRDDANSAHVRGCADCQDVLTALRAVRADIGRLGSTPMPAAVAARISAALTAERAMRTEAAAAATAMPDAGDAGAGGQAAVDEGARAADTAGAGAGARAADTAGAGAGARAADTGAADAASPTTPAKADPHTVDAGPPSPAALGDPASPGDPASADTKAADAADAADADADDAEAVAGRHRAAQVIELHSARRTRRLRVLSGIAAGIIVLGGGGYLVQSFGNGVDSAATSSDSAAGGGSAAEEFDPALPRYDRQSLEAAVGALLEQRPVTTAAQAGEAPDASGGDNRDTTAIEVRPDCLARLPIATTEALSITRAVYDGQPAIVVLFPGGPGRVQVTVVSDCAPETTPAVLADFVAEP